MDEAASKKEDWWMRARWLLGASYMLMYGLGTAWFGGSVMLGYWFPHSPWTRVVFWAGTPLPLWYLIAGWQSLFLPEGSPDFGSSKENGLTFVVAVCGVIVMALAQPAWTARLLGVLVAILFLGIGWMRGRRYYVAIAGWLVAGLAAPGFIAPPDTHVPWAPLGLIGGIGMAIQGAWELARSLRQRAAGAPPQFAYTPRPAGAS